MDMKCTSRQQQTNNSLPSSTIIHTYITYLFLITIGIGICKERDQSMSTSTQHHFRYTQTPSKVLHLRNLPWECSEEELIELCNPFGRIVNTKCNVGANRNQAFVEFVIHLFISLRY
jgi:hypothetical protein